MKLTFVEAEGFRGIRSKLRVEFGCGFTVICGRNGSGKSSICDAIEYVLTGTIQKLAAASERGEDVTDYVWWRGQGDVQSRRVTIGIADGSGNELVITRGPAGLQGMTEDALCRQLCSRNSGGSDGLRHLCRTTLLRDEDLTRLSIDMPEADRFAFVKAAIGVADFSHVEKKATEIIGLLKRTIVGLEADYEQARSVVTALKADQSALNVQLLNVEDVANAAVIIRELVRAPTGDVRELLTQGRREAAKLRLAIEQIARTKAIFERLTNEYKQTNTPDFVANISRLRGAVDTQRRQLLDMEQRLAALRATAQQLQDQQPKLYGLAQLHEHGSKMGLEEGLCPLCGSTIDQDAYSQHLEELRRRLEVASHALSQVVTEQSTLEEQRRQANNQLNQVKAELQSASNASQNIEIQLLQLTAGLANLDLRIEHGSERAMSEIDAGIHERQLRLAELEKNLAMLEASHVQERIDELTRRIEVAQKNATDADAKVRRAKTALDTVKEAEHIVKRVSGELVDESLAQVSPLLGELYFRLRPHVDWRQISYALRGDVRRFLRLTVANDLNPRFMFSSGQRRALALAFLLAVHMARNWCNLRTLILDDPVQHIDDYRALHLVEVLSGIRQLGRQVICTLEDPALADLLCRRLRSAENDGGRLVNLKYVPYSGVAIEKTTGVYPLPNLLKLSA